MTKTKNGNRSLQNGTKNGHARRPLTAAQKARDKVIREEFAHRPSLEELLATGDWEGPYNGGDIMNLLQFAGTLRAARLEAGHSLAKVARDSGIDSAALCRLEKGDNWNPTLDTLRRWARALGRRIVLDVAMDDTRQSLTLRPKTENGTQKPKVKGASHAVKSSKRKRA